MVEHEKIKPVFEITKLEPLLDEAFLGVVCADVECYPVYDKEKVLAIYRNQGYSNIDVEKIFDTHYAPMSSQLGGPRFLVWRDKLVVKPLLLPGA